MTFRRGLAWAIVFSIGVGFIVAGHAHNSAEEYAIGSVMVSVALFAIVASGVPK
jgi:hypothetical protein